MSEVAKPVKTSEEKFNDSIQFLQQVRSQRKTRTVFAIKREKFDPTNLDHLRSYYSFLETGKWGSVQFQIEYPFENAVDTVVHTFAKHALEERLRLNED